MRGSGAFPASDQTPPLLVSLAAASQSTLTTGDICQGSNCSSSRNTAPCIGKEACARGGSRALLLAIPDAHGLALHQWLRLSRWRERLFDENQHRVGRRVVTARLLVTIAILLCLAGPAVAECGERGGPGYRGPSGKCVGWAEIGRVCGIPPETRCRAEAVAPNAAEAAGHGARIEELRQLQKK